MQILCSAVRIFGFLPKETESNNAHRIEVRGTGWPQQ
jgi:hypothetical protein